MHKCRKAWIHDTDMHKHIHTYLPTSLAACLPTYLPTCQPASLPTYKHTHMHTYMRARVHACIFTQYTCTCTYTKHTRICLCVYIFFCMCIYIYTCMNICAYSTHVIMHALDSNSFLLVRASKAHRRRQPKRRRGRSMGRDA